VVKMKFADYLTKELKQQLNQSWFRREKPPHELTRKDWEELMGVH